MIETRTIHYHVSWEIINTAAAYTSQFKPSWTQRTASVLVIIFQVFRRSL